MSFSSDIKSEILLKIDNIKKNELLAAESFGEHITTNVTKQQVEDEYPQYMNIGKLSESSIKYILIGSFLSSGYIIDPNTDYHLEILFKNKALADYFINLLSLLDFAPKVIKRKIGKGYTYVVYIKESEQISIFLSIIEATSSMLKFEQIRVEKEVKNNLNRNINCEAANLSKVIKSSLIQIQAINKLKENNKYEQLDDKLKEVAALRIKHEYESLEFLSNILKISRSGVKHRLDKIIQIANEI